MDDEIVRMMERLKDVVEGSKSYEEIIEKIAYYIVETYGTTGKQKGK